MRAASALLKPKARTKQEAVAAPHAGDPTRLQRQQEARGQLGQGIHQRPKRKPSRRTRTTAKSAAVRRNVQRRTEPQNRESGAHDSFTGSRNLINEELRSQERLGKERTNRPTVGAEEGEVGNPTTRKKSWEPGRRRRKKTGTKHRKKIGSALAAAARFRRRGSPTLAPRIPSRPGLAHERQPSRN
jgi:hypothetical protein